LKNARNFTAIDEIYESICLACFENPRFTFGSLLKDYDYLNNQTIGDEQLRKILTAGCPKLTSGDIDFFIQSLNKKGGIQTQPLLDNVNKYLSPGQLP